MKRIVHNEKKFEREQMFALELEPQCKNELSEPEPGITHKKLCK